MKKILLTSLFAMLLSTLPIMAENNIGEKGINLDGQCKAIASSPDGSTYVLMEDRRLICIAPNGQKKEITIPLIDNTEVLTNLHVLEPPWENDKKIYPLRAITLIFVFVVAAILATIICNMRDYLEAEGKRESTVAREWNTFKGFFKKSKV